MSNSSDSANNGQGGEQGQPEDNYVLAHGAANLINLADLINNAQQVGQPSPTPEGFDIDRTDLDKQKKLYANERYHANTVNRDWLAKWTAWVVSVWLGVVLIIVVCNHDKIHLNDTVMVALLGTTTLNVLGLSFIVLKGYFNQNDENPPTP